jgi:hypothetical protein
MKQTVPTDLAQATACLYPLISGRNLGQVIEYPQIFVVLFTLLQEFAKSTSNYDIIASFHIPLYSVFTHNSTDSAVESAIINKTDERN